MNNHFNEHTLPSHLKVPKLFKISMGLLHFVSKSITLPLIVKLFSTPRNFKIPKRELGMFNSAQKKKIYCTTIQKDIEVLSYGFSDKKVLLAHGWSGRATQLFMIANHLLEQGYMVVSFDGPAHGNSTGKTTNLIEFIECVKTITEEFGPFTAGVGHSFGGLVLMNLQAKEKAFNCLVTIGTPDKVEDIFANFTKNLGLPLTFSKKLIAYFENKYAIKVARKATSFVAANVNIKTLVVHDALDGDVLVGSALHIRKYLKKGRLYITHGLGHTKILRNKKVTEKIVTFIKRNS